MRRMILVAVVMVVALGSYLVLLPARNTRIHVERDADVIKATRGKEVYVPYFVRENYFPRISIVGLKDQ